MALTTRRSSPPRLIVPRAGGHVHTGRVRDACKDSCQASCSEVGEEQLGANAGKALGVRVVGSFGHNDRSASFRALKFREENPWDT